MPELNLSALASRLARQPRTWLGPALLAATLALFLLAAGIGQLDMRPNPIYLPQTQFQPDAAGGGSLTLLSAEQVERLILILLMICTPALVLASLFVVLNSKARKVLIKDTLTRVTYAFIIFLVLTTVATSAASEYLEAPGEAFQGPQMPRWSAAEEMPSWMGFAVALLVLLGLSLLGWLAWRRFRPAPAITETDDTLKKLELEALASLEDLRQGGDLRNVIMRCYAEMSSIIGEKRGARRQDWMTPREFEGSLLGLGLPRQPVIDLTRLFEHVRYGAAQPSRKEEHQAVQALTSIVDAIGGRA